MCFEQTSSFVRNRDMFGQEYAMRIEDGEVALKSVMGTICSFILLFVTGAYSYFKLNVLINRKDTDITSGTIDLYYDDTEAFSY